MTDTTTPTDSGLIRKAASAVVAMVASIITSTANAIASHYDKFINAVLGAVFAIAVTWWVGYLNRAPPAQPAKVIEIVKVVPAGPPVIEAKIDALAKEIADLRKAQAEDSKRPNKKR